VSLEGRRANAGLLLFHRATRTIEGDLLKLEQLIFEQHEKAAAYDDEIIRLSAIWTTENSGFIGNRSRTVLCPQERWNFVGEMPECVEHNRLCELQEMFNLKKDALIKQMFATPARTAEGRRAKVIVLLGCVIGDEWRLDDKETEYRELMARNMLIEFVGGEPAAQLRDQLA
jgi:hypothetical protein